MSHFSHIASAALTDIGRKRKNNEDAYGAFPEHGVFCVADGMGGGDDGEVASAAVVRSLESFCSALPGHGAVAYEIGGLIGGIKSAVNKASRWIYERAKSKGLKGCGSTFVGVCFDPGNPAEAVALHAGDSRLYRVRGKTLKQITKDHSAAELIGAKNEDDINPMFRGMILRAVGIQPDVEIDATPFDVKEGDIIVICSDGLYKMLPDKKLVALVRKGGSPAEIVARLIQEANAAGGVDNITVVFAAVGRLPAAVPTVEAPVSPDMPGDVQSESAEEPRTVDTGTTCSRSGETFDPHASSDLSTQGNTLETIFSDSSTEATPEEGASSDDGIPDEESVDRQPTTSRQLRDSMISRLLALCSMHKGVCVAIAAIVAAICIILALAVSDGDGKGAAEPEITHESPGQTNASVNESADETARAKRAEAERIAAEKEAARVAAEKAEAERKAAEESRRKAEAERKAAEEAQRKAAEELKVAQEAIRKAEAERKAAEEVRSKAEAERKAAEEARRKAAEEAEAERRAAQEARRKAAEKAQAREMELRKANVEALDYLAAACGNEQFIDFALKSLGAKGMGYLASNIVEYAAKVRQSDGKTLQQRMSEAVMFAKCLKEAAGSCWMEDAELYYDSFNEERNAANRQEAESIAEDAVTQWQSFFNVARPLVSGVSLDGADAFRRCADLIRVVVRCFSSSI